jgi:hypothetical protein
MPRPAPEFQNVDRVMFETVIVPSGRPAVLRNLVGDWPMTALGRNSIPDLAAHIRAAANAEPTPVWTAPPEIEGRFSYSDDLKGLNHTQERLPIAVLLDRLAAHLDDARPPAFYAGGVPLDRCLPGLMAETPMPLLDRATERLTSLWLGNQLSTAAHWDLPQNLACVVAGRRRFTLFPTNQVANLYIGPVDFTLAGQPISLVDFADPDFERHPRFAEALDHAEVAELEPGDALYMPSLWFHHVQSLDAFGAMVNFWWRDGPAYMTTPLLTLLHGLLTIRDLPQNERDAWRAFFDHYLFRPTGEDPMAHIPEGARGLFAPMTREIEQRLKATLARPLTR